MASIAAPRGWPAGSLVPDVIALRKTSVSRAGHRCLFNSGRQLGQGRGGLNVAVAKPPRMLVLQGAVLPGTTVAPYDFTWTFELSPVSTSTTRLVVRERYAYIEWANDLDVPVNRWLSPETARLVGGVPRSLPSYRHPTGCAC